MSKRKAVAGLCILCALALTAFAAQSASAATKGTTLFTCKKLGPGHSFTKEHCAPADAGSGNFEHVAFAESTTTEITGTTINTAGADVETVLEVVQSGVEEQFTSELGHILLENEGTKSWVENSKETTGEHYYHGEAWLRFTNVKVPKPGEGCKVKGGEITTKKLKFTTKGQGDEILFEPVGSTFAEFEIEGCTVKALNGLYTITGKIKAQPNGATLNTTLANTKAQGTLRVRGQVASIESSTTVRGKDEAAAGAEEYTGTTLFTCKNLGPGHGFTREHCAPGDVGEGDFEHVAFAESTTTEITGTTINTAGADVETVLESTQAGVIERLSAELGHILLENEGTKSWVENSKETTGEHYYHGEAWLRFTNVTVPKPAGGGCKIKGTNEITSKKLKFTTKGQGDEVLFEPVSGTTFAEFTVEGCTVKALNGLYTITGKIKAQPNGATLNTTLANTHAQGTLKLRGQIASIESSTTVRATDKAAGDTEDTPLSSTTEKEEVEEPDTPLSPTTVETP